MPPCGGRSPAGRPPPTPSPPPAPAPRRRGPGPRRLGRSVATVTAAGQTPRAMLLAQALLAGGEVRPPEPGHSEGVRPGGLRFERDVRRTPHPALREVRVRVYPEAGGTACELVEMIRVPPA